MGGNTRSIADFGREVSQVLRELCRKSAKFLSCPQHFLGVLAFILTYRVNALS
jgi:hypothetical protein